MYIVYKDCDVTLRDSDCKVICVDTHTKVFEKSLMNNSYNLVLREIHGYYKQSFESANWMKENKQTRGNIEQCYSTHIGDTGLRLVHYAFDLAHYQSLTNVNDLAFIGW